MVATAQRGSQHREVHFSFPIARKEYTPDGDLIVYGPCTDGTLDADHQKVKSSWSGPALRKWIETGGNIRVQHSPFLYPAGKGLDLEVDRDGNGAHWLKALVAQSTPAFDLVEKGILRDFSIGVLDPVTVFDDFSAPGGTICGGDIGEVSLVDRGSNKNTSFTIMKGLNKGQPAWGYQVSFSGPPTPLSLQAWDVIRQHAYKTWIVKRKLKDGRVVDSSGKDRSGLPAKNFAGPDSTYPIENKDDVSDAASLAHHAADPAAVRSRIRSIARSELGMKDEEMPPSLTKADDSDDTCSTCHGSGKIMGGKRKCPDCSGPVSKGDAAEDYPGDKGDDEEEPSDYDADSEADDDKKSDKAVDARALRKKLIKQQRAALKDALSGGGGSTPSDTDWHPDPAVSDSGPAEAKGKKVRPARRTPDKDDSAQAEMPGSDWSGKSDGPSFGMRRLHDALCPHFGWREVRKAYGLKDGGVGAAIPQRELESLALDAITKGRFDEAAYFTEMLSLVGEMQHIGPDLLLDARKAYDGLFPTAHPTMQQDIRPSQFRSGYISSGHPPLAASGASGVSGLPSPTVHQVSAQDFQRGFISAGHSSMSPGGGRQATAGTAAFGQALNSLDRMHQAVTQLWPDMCPISLERQDYAATDQTGIRGTGAPSPAPAVTIGESATKMAIPQEMRLRKQLAKARRKARELAEENDRLGSMPDPELAPYRGLPELGGPVDRRSLVGKAVGGADSDVQSDDDEFARYVALHATSGNPTMRANAAKVLADLLPK